MIQLDQQHIQQRETMELFNDSLGVFPHLRVRSLDEQPYPSRDEHQENSTFTNNHQDQALSVSFIVYILLIAAVIRIFIIFRANNQERKDFIENGIITKV